MTNENKQIVTEAILALADAIAGDKPKVKKKSKKKPKAKKENKISEVNAEAVEIVDASLIDSDSADIETADNADTETTANSNESAKRSRRFSLITYISPDELGTFLKGAEWIQHYAYITHDKDVNCNGEPKETHTHLILYTYDAKTSSAIRKNFDRYSQEIYGVENAQNTMCQILHDITSQYRYLTHKDNPQKAQYDNSLIVCDDQFYWDKVVRTDGLTDCKSNSGLAMVEDLLKGTSHRTMCQRYGKDYIYHYKYILDMSAMIARQENTENKMDVDAHIMRLILATRYSAKAINDFFDMFKFVADSITTEYGMQPDFDAYLKGAHSDD